MKKALPFLGAAVSALVLSWSSPAQAQNMFSDVPTNHWAYQAVQDLQSKGIVEGYPDGLFRGKRMLTRYEFAMAIYRLLQKLPASGTGPQGERGPQGEQGAPGEKGAPGDSGIPPGEWENIKRLVNEFGPELRALGTNLRAVNDKIDAVAKDLADLRKTVEGMPKFSGNFYVYQRSDRSRFGFVDQGGAFRPANPSHFASNDVAHDLHLKIDANVKSGGKLAVDLVASNYASYRGGTFSQAAVANPFIAVGGPANPQQFGVYYAEYSTPVSGLGKDASLAVGRLRHQLTSLTLKRPDLDPYFSNSVYDDGNYIMDGVKFKTGLGSLGAQFFVGSFASPQFTTGGAFNLVQFGPSISLNGAALPATKLFGIDPLGLQQTAQQVAGINLNAPLFNLGEVYAALQWYSQALRPAGGGALPFDNMLVYSGGVKFNPFGRFKVNAEFSKSSVGNDIGIAGGPSNNEDNNAYDVNVGWGSGPLDVKAGYKYIDPGFGAPGSWGRIGNYVNPVNVQGPYAHIGYKNSERLSFMLHGDFLNGARNRRAVGNLNISDRIYRGVAGVNFKLSNRVSLMGNYEGVFYEVNGRRPVEQYITFGTDLNLTGNTMLRLAYQIIALSNFGAGAGAAGGLTVLPGGVGANQTATVFTTQLGVRF